MWVLNFSPIDPIKALYWSAVLNGVVAVPLMVTMMFMTMRRAVMARLTLSPALQVIGWLPADAFRPCRRDIFFLQIA